MIKALKEFKEFLDEYKVIPLAIAFVMGVAIVALVNAFVNDLIMPIITPFIPGGAWQTAILHLGPIAISWGHLVGAIINFIIIALVVFAVAKYFLKEEKVTKR